MSSIVLLSVAAALYLAATMRYQKTFYVTEDSGAAGWARGRGFIVAGFVMQTLSLVLASQELGGCPLTLAQSLSMICWMMVGLYMVIGVMWKMEVLGAFAAPTATLMMLASLATSRMSGPVSTAKDPLLNFHVACIVLGYAAFTLATIVAALYMFQTLLLKRKTISGVFQKMPSLENLDKVTYRLIAVGFFPMIIGIVLGFVRAENQGTRFWSIDVVLGIVTVLIYAVYINARLLGGWQGRRVNALLLIGFVFLIATYVGIGLPWSVHIRP